MINKTIFAAIYFINDGQLGNFGTSMLAIPPAAGDLIVTPRYEFSITEDRSSALKEKLLEALATFDTSVLTPILEALATFDTSVLTPIIIPIGTQLTIGKRRWKLVDRLEFHPHHMHWLETTSQEPQPQRRLMYPSEVQALIDAGFKIELPSG